MPGGVHARVLDVFAPDGDRTTYAWMIREIAARLAAYRPARIEARTTCAAVQAALRRRRFIEVADSPVHFWPGAADRPFPRPPLSVGRLVADDPLLPYPEEWPARMRVGSAESTS